MASLGEGGEEYTDQMLGLLSETNQSDCLHMAKLNLYQCLAVSRPHYEDVFCLGQHILADTGQCIVKAAPIRRLCAACPGRPGARADRGRQAGEPSQEEDRGRSIAGGAAA
ncbi:MAG: hypothetical protein WDN45_09500 [Caulobacteraceae bacterium]